ncbi:glycosyltransferase [Microcoleus sp. herbarium14]|uniref:glycosyltransferase n=1 Tax=Microcoleus sp. herbarium14 TaxID=3055439 RepID=UPI002FD2966F
MGDRICLVSNEFPPSIGGVGQSVSRIAKMLLKLGYEVHVAVLPVRSDAKATDFNSFRFSSYQTSEQDGIFVHKIKASIMDKTWIPSLSESKFLADCYLQLKLLYSKYLFKIFHAFYITYPSYITTLVARENGVPVINSVRGNDLYSDILSNWHSRIVWTLQNSSRITFVSKSLLEKAILFIPEIKNKSYVFYNSVEDIKNFNLPKSSISDNLKGLIIGSVGKFRYKKGINFLIESCKLIDTKFDFTLLLIGDFKKNELSYWQQEIENSGIKSKIILTGFLDRKEALKFLSYLDIFVIPSLHEGCPNAMLEAMVAGKAIIGTKVDAIGEILEDGVDAILINPASTDELISSLRKLASNAELRHQLGCAARNKCLKQFNYSVEQKNWEELYKSLS